MELFAILLFVLLLLREGTSYFERRDMLDRLMAKSLPEFKDNQTTEENQLSEQVVDDDALPIEEAQDELMKEDNGEEN